MTFSSHWLSHNVSNAFSQLGGLPAECLIPLSLTSHCQYHLSSFPAVSSLSTSQLPSADPGGLFIYSLSPHYLYLQESGIKSLLWTTLNYYTSALSPMYAHIYTAHLSFRFLLIFTLVLEMHKLTWTLTQTCIVSDVARWRSPRNLICIPHTFHRQLLCLWHNITHTHTHTLWASEV